MFGFRWMASDLEHTMDIRVLCGVAMLTGRLPSSWAAVVTWHWGETREISCELSLENYSSRLWSVETGSNVATVDAKSSVRCCNFSFSGNLAAYSTDKAMGHDSELYLIDVRTMDSTTGQHSVMNLPMKESKVTSLMWFLDDTIITGHENGLITSYDMRVSFIAQLSTYFLMLKSILF